MEHECLGVAYGPGSMAAKQTQADFEKSRPSTRAHKVNNAARLPPKDKPEDRVEEPISPMPISTGPCLDAIEPAENSAGVPW